MAMEEKRESWGSRASFLLACIGYAVGLGNIWRFPYNAYKSGGGAFLVPYLVMLVACGVPLLFMELAVGQYTRRGPIGALGKLCPLLQGAGLGTVIISFLLCTYYNVILAWSLFYLGASLQSPLPWASCGNWWNSPRCIGQESTGLPSNVTGVSATQEYFERRVLQQTAGIHDPGHLRLELLGLLTAAWVIVYFCLWKGVTLTGKVVYVTATLPVLLLLAFTIRGLSLPGAVDGVLFFITPDWSRITEPQIWVNAASQVFNSIGIAFGSLIAFASYNKFEGPVLRDTLIVTLADALVSLLCGVAVFAVLGNLAHEQGAEVGTVVAAGPGLVFMVFPHALASMPFPQLWSVVFFSLVVMLGVDSQFATVEVIITSVKDGWEGTTKLCSHEVLVLIICLLAFLAGIPNTFQGGIYWFTIIDYYSATISLMYVALFETVAVVWCYGVDRLAANVADMTGSAPGALCRLAWRVVAPGLIAVIWGFTLVEYRPPVYGDFEYPAWALGLGWGLTSLSLAAIPVVALRAIYRVERGSPWQRVQTAFTTTILHCPCCGAKLDHEFRAHYKCPRDGETFLHNDQKLTPV